MLETWYRTLHCFDFQASVISAPGAILFRDKTLSPVVFSLVSDDNNDAHTKAKVKTPPLVPTFSLKSLPKNSLCTSPDLQSTDANPRKCSRRFSNIERGNIPATSALDASACISGATLVQLSEAIFPGNDDSVFKVAPATQSVSYRRKGRVWQHIVQKPRRESLLGLPDARSLW